MKKIVILSYLIFSGLISLFSQNTFAKIYDVIPGNETSLNIMPSDYGYFLTGGGADKEMHNMYYKVNKEGKILENKVLANFESQSSKSIYKENDDLYIVLSNKKEISDYDTRLFIYHTNMNGDSLGLIKIDHEDSDYMKNFGILKINDDFYLLNLVFRNPDSVYYFKSFNSQLIKVSASGETDLLKEFDYTHTPIGLSMTTDSLLLTVQYYVNTWSPYSNRVVDMEMFDLQGKSMLHWKIETVRNFLSLSYILTPSDDYVVLFQKEGEESYDVFNYIEKFNKDSVILWRYDFDNPDNNDDKRYIDGITLAANGDIIGYGKCELCLINGEEIGIAPWIFRFDSSGNLLWERYYRNTFKDDVLNMHIESLIETENKNLVMTGDMRLFNTDSLNTDDRLFSFILKLDSSGFYSGFDTLQSIDFVYEKWFNGLKYEKIENAFEIYPNPTKDMIKVTLPEINNWHRWSIYDLTGRLRKNGTVDNKQDFIISGLKDLESGMYFLKVYDDQGKVGIGKFVVE